jgi:enolase
MTDLTMIENVSARKIMDSRGNWTIEVDIVTTGGFGRCAAPSGASKGGYEVVSFPKGGIDKAIEEVEETIAPEIIGMDSEEQEVIDEILREVDGTDNFSNIGGNTAVAISLANSKAAASSYGLPLFQFLGGHLAHQIPLPLGNVIGGGAHAKNATDIQEFLVVPVGVKNITEAIMINSEVHKKAGEILSKKTSSALGKGDEGAWAVDIDDREALSIVKEAAEEVSNKTGVEVRLGIDVAASELWNEEEERYIYARGGKRNREEQIDYILELIREYNLYYVEDPLQENDFEGFATITKKANCLICGDDLYVTSHSRLAEGVKKRSSNAVLIKPNQCGTLTDTYMAVKMARKNNLTIVMSHRSGETIDDTIAHLAVAFNSSLIKTGIIGGERIAKLNELIRISEELGERSEIANLTGG